MKGTVLRRTFRNLENYRGILSWSVLVFAFMLNYAHRLTLAGIGSEIMVDLAVGASGLGLLSAIYFYAYGAATVPAGILVDQRGARMSSTLGLFIAGVGGILFALASGLGLALSGRFLLATGLAFILPSIIKVQREWFPLQRFGTLTGITSSAGNFSALMALGVLVVIMSMFGWRRTVIGLSLLTFATGMLGWLII